MCKKKFKLLSMCYERLSDRFSLQYQLRNLIFILFIYFLNFLFKLIQFNLNYLFYLEKLNLCFNKFFYFFFGFFIFLFPYHFIILFFGQKLIFCLFQKEKKRLKSSVSAKRMLAFPVKIPNYTNKSLFRGFLIMMSKKSSLA